MDFFDDLRAKNKNTLNKMEKAERQQRVKKKTPQQIPQNTRKKSGKTTQKTTLPKKQGSNGIHPVRDGGIKSRKLSAGARAVQQNEIKTNPIPQAMLRFNERILNDGALAPVSIPYQITTGKKLLDFGLQAETDSAKKGAAVGNFIGTAAAYGMGYGAANKAIGKGAAKLLSSNAGKKATTKIIGSRLGQKAGKETAEKVAEGLARNLVGDATVGTLMNLSQARGEGLTGKELAKDMAVNAAFDAVLGTGFEFAPMALKAGKNALKNTKLEPRLVDGKVKNVRVRQQIPQNTAYRVSRSGSVNERLGAKLINEELGEIPRNVQNAPQEIPYAKRALAPEAQKKVFDAVEKRSGAKIAFADLPEGVDGTYQNGVITISNNAANPAYTVLKHELTHHIETSGHYAELSDFIQNSMRDAGYDVDQSINDIISDYAKMGKNLTAEEAQKEFTAKFAEEYLFNSEKSIERLARENPNIFRQIYDWIVDTVRKIGASEETKFLIDAQRKYEKALRTVRKTEDAGTKYMFYKASSEDVLKAEKMKAAGASEAEIKAKLNLHQDARGEWVSELSDQGAKLYRGFDAKLYNANPDYKRYADMWKTGDIFNPEFAKLDEIYGNVAKSEGNLDQILDHEVLFEKYPQLRRTPVRFENLEEGINGGFNPHTKQIVLSENLNGDDAMSTLLHEVQHNVQTLDGRNNGNTVAFAADNIKVRQNLAEKQRKEASAALETLVGEPLDILMTQAKQSGIREDIDNMWEAEDICRAMRKHFEEIGDTAAVERVDAFAKLYADLTDRVNQSFNEALYWKGTSPTEAYLKTSGEVEARQTASSRYFSEQDRRNRVPEKGIDLEGAGYSASLREFPDGRRFVEIDADTSQFDGLSRLEQSKFAVETIRKKFAGKVVGADNRIYVNGRGAREFGFPVKQLDAEKHSAKMRSSTELDNMFDAGHNFRNVPDGAYGHTHDDVTGGFDYYDVIFKVGDRYYQGTINVKNTNAGKLFKDITKIEDITEELRSSYGQNPKSTYLRTSSKDSIPANGKNVNKNTSFSAPLEARVSGDALLDAQDTIDLVKDIGGKVDENGYVTLYHRTSKENAEKIRSTGKMSAKEDGVFFSTSKTGYNDGYGDTIVEFKVPAEKLVLDDIFENEAHFKIPLKNRKEVLDVAEYLKNASMSIGDGIRKDEFLNRLKTASKSLYGEKGNKYLQIPYASEIPAKKTEPQPIPYAQKETPQQIPHADTIPKKRNVASESPEITTDERWDYMLETAPGERHARKLTEEEWTGPKKHAEDKFKAEHGITDRQAEVFYGEPRTEIKESKKAQQYERRQVREADKAIREALDINKYSDGPYIKKRMDETVEKMKNGSLSKAEKEQLFDDMFANGIKIDGEFATQYQDLKKVLRETPIKVSESIKKNIADFGEFRRRNVNKIRLNDQEGVQADIFYDELRNTYPELFPEVNTPEEMVEKIAEVADSIKIAEKRVSEDIYSDEIYTEAKKRFEEVMDNLENEVNIAKKNFEKHRSDITIDQMHEFITDLGKFKREAERVKSKVILNDEDRKLKDMLLKGQLTPETLRKINLNANNIIEVYEVEKPVFEMKNALKKLGDKTKESYREAASSILQGSEKWKDKIGFNFARETPERNFVDIAGKEAGERINREFITPIHEHEAAATRMKNELRGEVKKLKISNKKAYDLSGVEIEAPGLDGKQKVTEATLVQLYGEKLIRKEDIEFLGADVGKIENAVQTLRSIYNQLIEKANNELIRHGYEPIEFRKDYFPHFSEDKPDGMIAKIGSFLGIDVKKDELPTDIAGLTHTFKPGKKWFGNALQRTGKTTEYNAVKGFDIYIEGVADIIHHTEDIQKLRALESELRFKYSDDGIKKRVKEVKASDAPDTVKDSLIEKIYEEGNTRLGSLATWLRNYTDQLAGKKSQFDRVFEQGLGRSIYNTTKAIENRVAANMVALNPGSWLTNFIPLVQAGEISPKYVIEGMAQMIGNRFRKVDDITDISSFLTNRKGSNVLWKSNLEKAQDVLTSPMQMIDDFTSEALVRAKYAEQLKKGVHPEEAIKTADRFAADIIADRSKGALPTVFNSKNPITKILTMYQVEVNNQWSHLLKDIPRSKENVAQVALAFTNFAVGAYIFNDVYERLVGRRSALDPISWVNDFVGDATGKKLPNFTEALESAMKGQGISFEEADTKSGGGTIASLGENIAQDIPFVGGLLGGGRVPISSALPNVATVATNVGNLITGDVDSKKGLSAIGKELAKPATYIIPPVGGGQIKKAAESTRALIKGGAYGLDKDGQEQLKFAVDKTGSDIAKGILFGQYAIGNSGDYVDSGFKMLSAEETRAYKALTETGMKNTEAEDFIRSLPSGTTDMRNAIMNSNLTAKQKNAIGKILDEKSPDYTSKDSFRYSQMSDRERKVIKALTKTGMTQAKASRIYNTQKDYSANIAKVDALLEEGYHEGVMKALGLSETAVVKGKALYNAGLSADAYVYTRKHADLDGNGGIKKDELIKYLNDTAYDRSQKFALYKAIMNCKDKNNPYR